MYMQIKSNIKYIFLIKKSTHLQYQKQNNLTNEQQMDKL